MGKPYRPKVQVILPYEELEALLIAVEEIPQLRKEIDRLENQYQGLYKIVFEVIDKIGDLQKLI